MNLLRVPTTSEEDEKLITSNSIRRPITTCNNLVFKRTKHAIDTTIQTRLCEYIDSHLTSSNLTCFRDSRIREKLKANFSTEKVDNPSIILNIIGDGEHSPDASRILKESMNELVQITKSAWVVSGSLTKLNEAIDEGISDIEEKCNAVLCNDINVDVKYFCFDDGNKTGFGKRFKKEIFDKCGRLKANLVVGGNNNTLVEVVNNLEQNIPVIITEGSGGFSDFILPLIRQLKLANQQDQSNLIPVAKGPTTSDKSEEDIMVASMLGAIPNHPSHCFNRDLVRRCLLKNELITVNYEHSDSSNDILETLLNAKVEKTDISGSPTDDAQFEILSLCIELDCVNVFEKLLKEIGIKKEIAKKIFLVALQSSKKDSKIKFVRVLHKYFAISKWLQSGEISDWHMKSLYESDPILLKNVTRFIKKEEVNIRGLDVLATSISNLLRKKCKCLNDAQHCGEAVTGYNIFVWALFFEQYELAKRLWSSCYYPTANAVTAASLLRSLKTPKYKEDGIYTEERGNNEKEEQAKWYEENAVSLLMECQSRDPIRTKFILTQNIESREVSCIELAVMDDDNEKFLSNHVCERHLDNLWMTGQRNTWKSNCLFAFSAMLIFAFVVTLMLCIVLDQILFFWTGLVISVVAWIVACFIQTGKIFDSWLNRSYVEIRPLEAEEKEDKEYLEGLTSDGMMALFKVGIDLSKLLPEVPLYAEIWRIWSNRHPIWVFLHVPFHKFIAHFLFYTLYMVTFWLHVSSLDAEFSGTLPGPGGWMIWIYWIALFTVEFNQFHQEKQKHNRSDRIGVKKHFSTFWNKFDLLLFVYCIIFMAMRIYYITNCYSVFEQGHDVSTESKKDYCFERSLILHFMIGLYFVLWMLRGLQLFVVSRNLGPKLIMIVLMIKDLSRVILYILLMSSTFGIWMNWILYTTKPEFYNLTSNAASSPNSTSNVVDSLDELTDHYDKSKLVQYIDSVFGDPYWNLFGDGLRDNDDPAKCATIENCHFYYDFIKKLVLPSVRMIYMLLTAILLLNLLIAIFNDTISHVTSRSNQIWNVIRKDVLLEFSDRLPIPIPFALISPLVDVIMKRINRNFLSTLSFTTTPLNIKPRELAFSDGTNADKLNHENGIDQIENENTGHKNLMKDWFKLVTEWEKAIHYKIEKESRRTTIMHDDKT